MPANTDGMMLARQQAKDEARLEVGNELAEFEQLRLKVKRADFLVEMLPNCQTCRVRKAVVKTLYNDHFCDKCKKGVRISAQRLPWAGALEDYLKE
jgi:hypothetical protein